MSMKISVQDHPMTVFCQTLLSAFLGYIWSWFLSYVDYV